MRKRNWTLFAVLAALAALAALSIGSAGSAVAASASASASAAGGEEATAARRRGRRGARGRRGRRGARGLAGATGGPGPQGPPGTVSQGGQVSGGWTKIFFAANGIATNTTLININNFVFESNCEPGDHEPEFRTLIDNSHGRATSITGIGDTPEYNEEEDFDIGEVFDEGDGLDDDEVIWDVILANTVGQMVKVNVMLEDEPDELFNSTDCAVIGAYVAL